jgi:molecular chaperone DnaJ
MSAKDFYQLLGVGKTATPEEIKKAYHKLARKYHPDLNPGDKKSEEQFKEMQTAYDVLSDPEKRKKYDQYGSLWEQAPAGGGGGPRPGGRPAPGSPFEPIDLGGGESRGFQDFIEEIFGQNAGHSGFAPPRPGKPAEDIEFSLDITLEEAFKGVSKPVNVTVEDVCNECGGTGQKRNSQGRFDLGKNNICPRCHGRGRTDMPRSGQVTVPAGAWDGLRLKLSGQGPTDARGRRGDLFVRLHILPHARFEREGQDLYFDLSVPYTVAALGGEATVTTVTGQPRELVVPKGIQSGQKMRLGGQGMPALQERKAGDAYARIKITVPKDLTDQERSLLEQLAALRNDPIRAAK